MRDLVEIRSDIDEVDQQILDLYRKRLSLATEVAEFKIANQKNVYDKVREEEKLQKLSGKMDDPFLKQGVRELFEQIMSASRKKQYRMLAEKGMLEPIDFSSVLQFDFTGKTIVFQGVEGAYSQAAMQEFFGGNIHNFHVETWREAMECIVEKRADYAVLPIENSSAGAVIENYDLMTEYNVTIIGEQIIKINHALLGIPGAKVDAIRKVYSHPQALMQCSEYLRKHPEIETVAMDNTALSAKKVKEDDRLDEAAIAGEINTDIYGLSLLERSIQNEKDNETRFIIVSSERKYLETADKVSLCFELPNEEGSLYHILSHFIFNGINLSRIESRPIHGKTWEYRFFIDFEGNLKEEAVINALRGLQEETKDLRILGNY